MEKQTGAIVNRINRREFIKYAGMAGGTVLLGMQGGVAMSKVEKSQVSIVHTENRKSGVTKSIDTLGYNPVNEKNVLIKPNFNTADPVPGSSHNDTLVALVEKIWDMGAKTVCLGERSYPLTKKVMEDKGILPRIKALDVKIIDFDELSEKDWVPVDVPGSHWKNGFRVARPILETDCLVSTCCLKTHQYGGVFTMSLKLHVGAVPTSRHGFNYMTELHSSPHQQKMIAEINAPFRTDLVVLDGVDVFVDGGPMTGKKAKGNVFLASSDRIAIDAVGLAILKHLGSNAQVMKPKIFDQEQIARAVELGIGASSLSDIDLIAADDKSRSLHSKIESILNEG